MTSPNPPGSNGAIRTNGKSHRPESTKENPAPGAWRFGMAIFLASLAVLFLASIVATLVIRFRTDVWPPPGMPRPPAGLWISTAILAVSSLTMELSVWAAERDRKDALRVLTLATTLLAVAFLVTQVVNWFHWVEQSATIRSSLYAYLFYVLTGLHAAHVLGGLVPLVVVTVNSAYGRYSSVFHEGVKIVAVYWHFLGVVWAVLFTLLLTTTA